jgi:hypothetical protein
MTIDIHNDSKNAMKINLCESSFAVAPVRSLHQDLNRITSFPHIIPNDHKDESDVLQVKKIVKKRNVDTDITVISDRISTLKRIKTDRNSSAHQDLRRLIQVLQVQMNHVANQVLRHEALLVKKRTISWTMQKNQIRFSRISSTEPEETLLSNSHQQLTNISCTKNMESALDVHATANFETSDAAKQSILYQASRMKRMSILFQQLNQLHSMLLIEIDNISSNSTGDL